MHRILLLAGFIAGTACAAQAQDTAPATPVDWKARLEADVTAFHDAIMDSHPGPVDPLNPGFRPRAEAGLKQALQRAKAVDSQGGWWWALRAYQAAFDDGHVQLWSRGDTLTFGNTWPGFLTAWRGKAQVVAAREEGASLPPLGAQLIDCDGTAADALAAERVGTFRGRWFLESQRVTFGSLLFVNASNPYLKPLKTCRFKVHGAVKAFTLNWKPISDEALGTYRQQANPQADYRFGVREVDGGWWISTPGFNGNTQSDDFKALTQLIAQMQSDQARLQAAPRVVLDLRGNGGGASRWSYEMARLLWGEDWLKAHEPKGADATEWRPSEANIAAIEAFLKDQRDNNGSPEAIAWAERAIAGMKGARAGGLTYWRDADDETAGRPAMTATTPLKGRVFVLTDTTCGSACLDAVDLWKALGAVQVGRETSADTLYMELREQPLTTPGVFIAIPMKVYRGRPRGNNEPQRPAHAFEGDMSDDAALLTWIKGL